MERVFGVNQIILTRLFCDKCQDVEMVFKAPAIALAPGQPQRATYACPKCGFTHVSHKRYPEQNMELIELIPATLEPADATITSEQVKKVYEQQGGVSDNEADT
jgi:RNase P subunit RPR2